MISEPETVHRRAFLALPVPLPIAQGLSELLDMPEAASRVVHPADYHITLHFLGDQPASVITELSEALSEALPDCPCAEVALTETVAFPSVQHPRLIAASVQPNERLSALHACTHRVLTQLAGQWPALAPESRPWRPHVTMCWLKRRKPDALPAPQPLNISFTTTEVRLYASRAPQVPRYQVIHTWPLSSQA